MKTKIFIFLIIILTSKLYGQSYAQIEITLDSMFKEDQKWRGLSRQLGNHEIDSLDQEFVSTNLQRTDSLNYFLLVDIFNEHGYLGTEEIGAEGTHNYWLLVQHQDKNPEFQNQVLEKMKLHAERGNMNYFDYVFLVDRVKVNTSQLQVYGTQMMLNADSSSYIPKPVIDPENLNEIRKQAGLPTIEEYIELMNERYFGTLKK